MVCPGTGGGPISFGKTYARSSLFSVSRAMINWAAKIIAATPAKNAAAHVPDPVIRVQNAIRFWTLSSLLAWACARHLWQHSATISMNVGRDLDGSPSPPLVSWPSEPSLGFSTAPSELLMAVKYPLIYVLQT